MLDASNPALRNTVNIVFQDPPTTYQINGAGPLIPYSSGNTIDLNGWRVQISGAPVAGDTFTIRANTSGFGDNANGLALADLATRGILDGGANSVVEGYGNLVGVAGAKTRQAELSHEAFQVLRNNAIAAREEISGVNLDEEAANMLRFQQLYQASAQIVQAGQETIDALLSIMR